MAKVVIVLLSDTETKESLGRALHSIIYAQELAKNNEVRLIFDGAGVKWINKFLSDAENPATKAFMDLNMGIYAQDIVKDICKFCSGVFAVPEADSQKLGFNIADEYKGHPDLAKLMKEGFQVITL